MPVDQDGDVLEGARWLLELLTPGEVQISVWFGVVLHCWRNPLEEFHVHVGDAEMARITIATQRAVEPFVGPDTVARGSD